MKRKITFSLFVLMGIAMQAQEMNEVKVLAKSEGAWVSCPEAVTDKKTKKKVVEWRDTENNSWHDDMGIIDDVPIFKDLSGLFRRELVSDPLSAYVPMLWRLTEENSETVLHCYFRMPADVVKNMWLCSDECVILDKETGTIYRSRRTVPDCYGKVFSVKAKEGAVLDFQIFFPALPDSTKKVAIYGVPNWMLRGEDVTLTRLPDEWAVFHGHAYDTIPRFHKPHLVAEANNYDKDDHKTWAVYDNPHLIMPVEDGTYAIWLTEEATYLAEACEMNWMREYFGLGGNNLLVDQRGHQYKCKGTLNYPKNDLFWNEGVSGDYFALVRIFDPLPIGIDTVTLIVPEGEPFAMWGANWSGKVQALDIYELRQNQRLFEYHPRQVVE